MRAQAPGQARARAVCVLLAVLAVCAALLLPALGGPTAPAAHASSPSAASQKAVPHEATSHADPGDATPDTHAAVRGVPLRAARSARTQRPALPSDTPPAPPCTGPPCHGRWSPVRPPAFTPATAARGSAPDAGRASPPPPGS